MIVHAGRKHYLYSASGADRWMNCAGSIQLSASMPPGTQSAYALDGEEAHELLEYALVNGYRNAREAFMLGDFKWTHRHDTEDERINSVQECVDNVWETIEAYAPDVRVFLECQFRFPTTLTEDAGGTSDILIYIIDFDILHVTDFKHGAGKAVEADENKQLLFYAVGARHELREKHNLCNSGGTMYVLRIVQPRAFHKLGGIREWTCDDARLDAFVGEVDTAIRKTQAQVPEIKPGSWCRWCPAFMACPQAEQDRIAKHFGSVSGVGGLAGKPLPPLPGMDVEKLAQLIEAKPMIMEYIAAAEALALELNRQGVMIPRHKAVLAQARRKWHGDDRSIAVALANIVGGADPNAFTPKQLVTITEAERMIKDAVYKRSASTKEARAAIKAANEAMAVLTTKDTSGNVVLVSRDDKRPEINVAGLMTYNPVPST